MRLEGAFEGSYSDTESLASLNSLDLDEYAQFDIKYETKGSYNDLKGLLKEKMEKSFPKQFKPERILLRDKIAFMLGTVFTMLSAYWLGWSPATFYRVYTVQCLVLFSVRWVMYRLKRWHYYLFDFCYFANVLLLVHLWFFPHSAFLHKVTFAYSAGPLAWSVIAFRNSLVFHDIDKVTTMLLHWMPACVGWTERWHPDVHVRQYIRLGPGIDAEWRTASLVDLVLLPLLPYLAWAFAYYIKIFVISSEKIQRRGYLTLFKYTTGNKKNVVARFVGRFPQRWQPLVYMALHISLTAATLALTKVWWTYYWAHSAFLLAVLSVSAWNGACFYFEVFAHRYVAGLGIPDRGQKRGQPLGGRASPAPGGQAGGEEGPLPAAQSPHAIAAENAVRAVDAAAAAAKGKPEAPAGKPDESPASWPGDLLLSGPAANGAAMAVVGRQGIAAGAADGASPDGLEREALRQPPAAAQVQVHDAANKKAV